MSVTLIFCLLVIFQLKHFLADYIFQGRYMLGKFKVGFGFILPLASHAAVHGVATFLISSMFCRGRWSLAFTLMILDVLTHFIIDRVKASPNLLGRYKYTEKYFWWCLGWDQMMHHLVHYSIIYMIVTNV